MNSSISIRNNVRTTGSGTRPMMFAHGFGCDQNMWRLVAPHFENSHKVILFDHVGAGNSDITAYDPVKYDVLDGYADDIIEIARELGLTDIIFVGHSVAAMMGVLAALKAPGIFHSLVLVAPSPFYINEDEYTGGFTRPQVEELLDSLEKNHLGWSQSMAPAIMANPDKQELKEELSDSFCRMDPVIARQFARTTFLSDTRSKLCYLDLPALILQCSEDIIAPLSVGSYVHDQIRGSNLVIMKATGHCPNLSAPEETINAIRQFLS